MLRLYPVIIGIVHLAFTLAAAEVYAQSNGSQTLSRACPFSCRSLGLNKNLCRDYRIGNQCYVQKLNNKSSNSLALCKSSNGKLIVKTSCAENEILLKFSSLQGNRGETGATGPQGPQGRKGNDGDLKIFGDGSGGDRVFSSDTIFDDSNPQYKNFSIAAGVTLTVHSGTVIRCTESFVNNGTILVLNSLRNGPKYAESGGPPTSAPSATNTAPGGSGGDAIGTGVARTLLRPSLMTSGDGNDVGAMQTNGFGGGSFVIMSAGSIINSNGAIIVADGESALSLSAGGGAGGLVVLAAKQQIINYGGISAKGGNGAALEPDNGSAAYAAGGGGGGGIIHLFAENITDSGNILIDGGLGGLAGSAGSLTGILKYGGRGGGGGGGNGGEGGAANPGNAGNGSSSAGSNGNPGKLFITHADPTAFL